MSEIIDKVIGAAIPLRGTDIDTDRIIPARYLRCISFAGLGDHAFEDDRKQKPDHPFNDDRYRDASILLVGMNFGCGSSREHAPQSLNRWGIKALVGISFAEIFSGNCQAMGIPCFTVDADDCSRLMDSVEDNPLKVFELDLGLSTIQVDGQTTAAVMPPGSRQSFLEGTWNATSVLLQADDLICQVARKLPYLHNFGLA